jgi:hypothetical protein
MPNGIAVTLLFVLVDRTACFAHSDQPTVSATGSISARAPLGYHLGVRLRLSALV